MTPNAHRPLRLSFLALLLTCLFTAFVMSFNVSPSYADELIIADEVSLQSTQAGEMVQRAPTATRTPTPVNIGNLVWDDLDKDGRQDAGEPGIAGVAVELWNSTKTKRLDTDVTDANGIYRVVAPRPMSVYIKVILPISLDAFSPKNLAGGDELLDSDVNPTGRSKGFTDVINIASNVISMTSVDIGIIIFREPTPTRTPTPVNIGNFVWHDLDGDGAQDGGEPGIAGVRVEVWNSTKTSMISSTITNNSGGYTLTIPQPADVYIKVILPAAHDSFSPKDAAGGDDLDDSDINPSGSAKGFTSLIIIASNVISMTSIDAGIILSPASTDTLALFGSAANSFSLINTLQDPAAPAHINTFASGSPIKGKFVMGDWNGDGQKTPALFKDGSFWYTNSIGAAGVWLEVETGVIDAVNLVAGRFQVGVAHDCFGLVRIDAMSATKGYPVKYTCELAALTPPSGMQTQFVKVNIPGDADFQFVAGDWNGDGLDSIAARREGRIKWSDTIPSAGDTILESVQNFGAPKSANGLVVAGDWNGDGVDTFGLFYKGDGSFFWRNDLASATLSYLTQTVGKPVGEAVASSWRDTE